MVQDLLADTAELGGIGEQYAWDGSTLEVLSRIAVISAWVGGRLGIPCLGGGRGSAISKVTDQVLDEVLEGGVGPAQVLAEDLPEMLHGDDQVPGQGTRGLVTVSFPDD